MCGIYVTNKPYIEQTVLEKLKLIKYRGPDNTGYCKSNNITLGHLRLSILDLDVRSNQPFSFENLELVYNGEIYNFQEIKLQLIELGYQFETTSDTEVLIKGYHAWGKDILTKINGMFAFVIHDRKNNKLFCARDRMGVKPFFYYWKNGEIEICSQLGPLINSNSKVSEDAVSIYLDLGYVPSPLSILKDVYKLQPGKLLIVDLKNGDRDIQTYWDLKEVQEKKISYNEAKNELHNLLTDAVRIRLQSDVNLGSFLSGGIDSALVSSIASHISNTPINTFTVGFEDPKYDESKVARQYANIIKSNHRETICTPEDIRALIPKLIEVYDEPFADSSALPSLLLNKITKEYVTVALSGDGGDESFLGYSHFDKMQIFLRLRNIPIFIRKLFAKFPIYRILNSKKETISAMLSTKDSDTFAWKIFTGFNSLQIKKVDSWYEYYSKCKINSKSAIQRMADLNLKLWLENDSNVKVDRASMAYSVEVRSPFLDYRIIEFARSLPVKFRYYKGIKKRITKDILKEYIPEDIFNQPKKGFSIPLSKWIRKELKEDFTKTLNDDFLGKVPNLNISLFKKQYQDHMENKNDYSFSLWKLYLLSKWYSKFENLINENNC